MAAGRVGEHSDFDAALSAGVGVSGRLWCRRLAGNMRTTLVCDERVADDQGHERPRPIRSLVMVTNRRVIEGVHPIEFRDFALERVTDVQVRSRSRTIATVRVSADGQDRDIDLLPYRCV